MCPSLRVDHPAPATHHAGRTRVVKRATATSPHTSCRHVRCADRLIEGRHLHRPRGTRICHELLSPAPSVLALTIRVVPTGLPALLITPVHFAPPTPLALQPTRHAAIGMAAVARAADVEQTPTSAVTQRRCRRTTSRPPEPTALSFLLDSTPAIVASFKPLVARASFAGGGPPKTPVALDDRGFFFARTISRKRVARLTARMMTGRLSSMAGQKTAVSRGQRDRGEHGRVLRVAGAQEKQGYSNGCHGHVEAVSEPRPRPMLPRPASSSTSSMCYATWVKPWTACARASMRD